MHDYKDQLDRISLFFTDLSLTTLEAIRADLARYEKSRSYRTKITRLDVVIAARRSGSGSRK